MGPEDGDVIRDLKGEAVTSPEQTVDLYRAVRDSGALALAIKRGDSTAELHFDGHGGLAHSIGGRQS